MPGDVLLHSHANGIEDRRVHHPFFSGGNLKKCCYHLNKLFVLCYPEYNLFTLVVCVFVICCKDRLLVVGIKDKKVLLPSRAAGLKMEGFIPQTGNCYTNGINSDRDFKPICTVRCTPLIDFDSGELKVNVPGSV